MIAQSVAEILGRSCDCGRGDRPDVPQRYVPRLQHEVGIVGFFRDHRGQPLPSAALMEPMSRAFVAELESFTRAA